MRAKVVIGLVGAALALASLAHRAAAQAPGETPVFQRAPDALERVTWRTRTLVGDDRLTNWDLAIATQTLPGLTFLEGVVRAEAAVVDFVEGAETQTVSPDRQTRLDFNLTAQERIDIKARMGPVRLLSYGVGSVPVDPASLRKVLEFAKDMNAGTIVFGTTERPLSAPPSAADLARLDQLANAVDVNVALYGSPQIIMPALTGTSNRLGLGIDIAISSGTTSWRDALTPLKDKLTYVRLRDRARGNNVRLGQGEVRASELFLALNALQVRPLVLSLDASGIVKAPADLFGAIDAFEQVAQLAYGQHFTDFSRTRPIRRDLIRPAKGETLTAADVERRSADMMQQIRKAIPAQPYAAPQKPRKLLVVESLQGMSHDTIPHANVMLEEMGKITGAWTTEFSNDLENLKYPKVKDYDGIFLNSIVGEFAPDLAVRDGLLRFVKEGGGVGGVHGTPWASRNWDEFGILFGAKSAPHRIEQGVMRVYDAASPLVAPFGGKPLNFREEYYRFEHQGMNRLRWEDVRVLLTVDLDDPAIEPRPWTGYKRPDNVYPVSWIRTYGKGRMFYSSLGHMPETFTTPALVGHFLAGVQYLLGDLAADATPNPRAATGTPAPQPSQPTTPPPAVPSLSQRPTGSSLGTIRVGASDNNIWFGWRVGVPTAVLKPLSISDVLPKTDLLSVPHVELSDAQQVSVEVPKPLDLRLQPGERNAVVRRLRELNQQVLAYRVTTLPADAATRRGVFELARNLNAPLIIVAAGAETLAELDALAAEFNIGVAIESRSDPAALVAALTSRSPRLGLAADLSAWLRSGVPLNTALAATRDRLRLVRMNPASRDTQRLSDFFLEAYRAGIKPLSIVIEPAGATEAHLAAALAGFEQLMWPAMAARVRTMLASPAGAIRGPDKLEPDMRRQIAAAAPRQALRPPARPRKLLVTDIQMYSGHTTIPHGNWLLELMGKQTGAFTPVFSNDLDLLKYPKIREFDAVYLNNVCGMVYNDPEVRDGLLRFVREGGGIGGHHAVTFANNHWPEFAEMMGGWAGAHHIETQIIKVDDPGSPLTASFKSASFEHTDEFYIFPPASPYSRSKQRVLLSIDVAASDRATEGRFCAQCTRPDQDYGLAWIRSYGKGRTYFTPLGHTTSFYTDERWTTHLLAAIQFILGDLEADASPNARPATDAQKR
jgi:type 1 glutamine amidotransferase